MLVIHLGFSGLPKGNATSKRIFLTFKALLLGGYTPVIINKLSLNTKVKPGKVNRHDGIPYIHASPWSNRPDNFLLRNLNKVLGYAGEFLFIAKKRQKIGAAIFYHSSFSELCYYRLLSKIFRFKLIVQYVELRSAITDRQRFFLKLNDRFFDTKLSSYCDGIIVISEYLRNRVLNYNKQVPIVKVPAICNFDEFKLEGGKPENNYLMYCGGIGYVEVIDFVVDVYLELAERKAYDGNLLLAIGGGEDEVARFARLREKIQQSGYSDRIQLFKDVQHDKLIRMYMEAEILMIPLRNHLQDIAGFHHKIGEYTAAAKPIISTDLGEVHTYFEDMKTTILSPNTSKESYIRKLDGILKDKELLARIGKAGHELGLQHLNYLSYVTPLKEFLGKL
ncbi:MAG: glycosyltransferase [Bacteroidales bacterium]|nr:glycosyltransferase [Bacteroidales bacterium]